jgi:predicted MFS family arabinose efflux permease
MSRARVWALTAASSLGIASPGYIHHGLAAIGPVLISVFSLSKGSFGFVISVFSAVGALTSPVVGRIADRVGGVRLLRWAFYLAVGVSIGLALSPGLAVLVAVAMLAGLTASAANPATNTLIGSHVPHRLQGLTVGVKQSGGPLGIALAGAVMPSVAEQWGWEWAVLTGAALPIVGLLLLRLSRVQPDQAIAPRDKSVEHPPLGRRIRVLTLNAAAIGWGMGAVLGFVSVYAVEEAGMDETTAGGMLAVIGFVGVGARLFWGAVADRVRSLYALLVTMGVLGLVSTAGIWLAADRGPWMLIGAAALFGASIMAWNSVGMLAVIREAASERAGAASGVVIFGFLAGLTLGPWAFGALVDASNGYALPLVMVAIAYLFSIAVLAIRSPESAPMRTSDV